MARKWMIIIIQSPRISESVCFSRQFHIVYYTSDAVMDVYLSMGAGFAIFCVILQIQWAFSHKCFPSGEKHSVNRKHKEHFDKNELYVLATDQNETVSCAHLQHNL